MLQFYGRLFLHYSILSLLTIAYDQKTYVNRKVVLNDCSFENNCNISSITVLEKRYGGYKLGVYILLYPVSVYSIEHLKTFYCQNFYKSIVGTIPLFIANIYVYIFF